MNPPSLLARWTVVIAALVPLPALAYVDPNAGGLLFQILAPLIATATGAVLFLRDHLKAALVRWFSRRPAPLKSESQS